MELEKDHALQDAERDLERQDAQPVCIEAKHITDASIAWHANGSLRSG